LKILGLAVVAVAVDVDVVLLCATAPGQATAVQGVVEYDEAREQEAI
jgi:methylmalonyl-CoA mutase cobalamin-binding subunit